MNWLFAPRRTAWLLGRLALALAVLAPAALAPTGPSLAQTGFFSDDFVPPAAKQGVGDAYVLLPEAAYRARIARLAQLGVKYKQYNYFWEGIERAGIPSSPTPIACPPESFLLPSGEAEKAALGYRRFRCLDRTAVESFDRMLRLDGEHGIQSGVVMWATPRQYIHPDCAGDPRFGRLGCVPRDDAMEDFADYANFLASRYDGGAFGKISHFIVWNESASTVWFDYSPAVAKGGWTEEEAELRIGKYAAMMKAVHAALQRHQRGALMYASTDLLWDTPDQAKVPGHLGSRRLLDGLWARLGTAYSWSVAVHPYGRVDRTPRRGIYSFANLELVSEYQRSKLREAGAGGDLGRFPQTRLIASEQGWDLAGHGRAGQARQICLAHARAISMPELVAVAHNYFQSVEPQEATGGESNQGAFYGLLPPGVPVDLAGMESTDTGAAYVATLDPRFGSGGDLCCTRLGVSCPVGGPPRTGAARAP
ncbi:MAG: hypothetical protein JWR08_1618 [Enterovirga sp.]|nr:hypothetical protein [Enterovirga sp.]